MFFNRLLGLKSHAEVRERKVGLQCCRTVDMSTEPCRAYVGDQFINGRKATATTAATETGEGAARKRSTDADAAAHIFWQVRVVLLLRKRMCCGEERRANGRKAFRGVRLVTCVLARVRVDVICLSSLRYLWLLRCVACRVVSLPWWQSIRGKVRTAVGPGEVESWIGESAEGAREGGREREL